jgi:hypothetical protein
MLVMFGWLALACSGRGHAPEDSTILHCGRDGLSELFDYCAGPTLSEEEECLEGDVRINCTVVWEQYGEGVGGELEQDRCAPAQYMQSICGEVIPCSVADNDTIYPSCGA